MENNEQKPTRCGFVSLIGAPNAGKSTITNDFVGSKVSIVSPKAQTTRTLVKGIGIFDNTQIIFLDTPGIFKPKRRFDRSMVASAWSGASDGDILVLVVDARRGFDAETRAIVDELNKQGREAVLVLNKTDLVTGQEKNCCRWRRSLTPPENLPKLLWFPPQPGKACGTFINIWRIICRNRPGIIPKTICRICR